MRCLDSITDSMDMSLHKFQEKVKDSLACCSPWGHKESDMTEQLTLSLSRCWAGISVPYVLVVLSGQICGVGEDS